MSERLKAILTEIKKPEYAALGLDEQVALLKESGSFEIVEPDVARTRLKEIDAIKKRLSIGWNKAIADLDEAATDLRDGKDVEVPEYKVLLKNFEGES